MKQRLIKSALSVTDEGLITGIAWVFDRPDRYGDTISKGALSFPDTLPILWSHKDENAIGVWEEIKETARGIEVRGRLLIDEVPLAKQVFALIKSGGVNSLSIGFWPHEFTKNSEGGNHISAGELVEISIVSAPAHPDASITSIKSAKGGKGKRMAKAAVKIKELEAEQNEEGNEEETAIEERVDTLEDRIAAIEETVNGTAESVTEVSKSLKTLTTKLGRPGVIRNAANDDEKPEEIQKKAFVAYLRNGDKAPEIKSLRSSIDGKGGYLAPPEFVKEMIRELVEFSPVRAAAKVGSTGSPSVIIPGRTGASNAQWVGELEESEGSEIGFDEREIPIHELATWIDVPNATLADADINLEAEIRGAFAEDLGVKESTAFVWGNGVKKPEGFMVRAGVPETLNGHATDLKADALITLLYAQPQAYRNSGEWAMNGNTLATLRKLKDGQGNYLWQPAYAEGQPERILGRPVVEMIDMPDIAGDAFPIAYGDFSGYRIYDRLAMDVLVDPYSGSKKRMTTFHVTRRLGGGLIEPKKFRKLKMATS